MIVDKKKGLIKVKSKYVVIFMTFIISCFLMAIYFSNKRAEKYGIADYGTEIQPTFLKGGLSPMAQASACVQLMLVTTKLTIVITKNVLYLV